MEEEKIQEHMMVKRSFEYLSTRRCAPRRRSPSMRRSVRALRCPGIPVEMFDEFAGFEKQQLQACKAQDLSDGAGSKKCEGTANDVIIISCNGE
jgi:hypothetical protein